jgi:DNA-binding MarR family transcriptional regulator
MDADRLAPNVRRVVDAAGGLDERLLVLLFFRKSEPAPDLMEMLGSERAETVTALGKLSHAGLVSHHRPEGEPIHWFATPEGKAQAEQLHRAVSGRLAAEPGPETDAAPAPEEAPAAADSPDHQRVRTRRRVAIDQNEKTGFSWD